MTRQMTRNAFAELFLTMFTSRIDRGRDVNGCDCIIVAIFLKYRKDILDHLEGSLPPDTYEGSTIDWVGPTFHKGFRSWDPIDSPEPMLNAIVWKAMTDASAFWDVMNQVCEMNDAPKPIRRVALDDGE